MRHRSLAFCALLLLLIPCVSGASSGVIVPQGAATLATVIRGLGIEYRRTVIAGPSLASIPFTEPFPDTGRFSDTLNLLVRVYHLRLTNVGNILIVRSSGARATRISLRYATASVLARQLATEIPQGALVVADPATNALVVSASPASLQTVKALVAAFDVPPTSGLLFATIPVATDPAKVAKEAASLFPQHLGQISIVGDPRIGAVIVSGSPGQIAVVKQLISEVQHHIYDVHIYARVYDITPTNVTKHIGIVFGGSTQGSSTTSTPYSFFAPSIGSAIAFNAAINALISTGHARILASPNTEIQSGDTGELHIGDTLPIVYSSGGLVNTVQIETVNTGLLIKVSPIVNRYGHVHLQLSLSYSTINGSQNGYPILATRSVTTTLNVAPNEVVHFAGLTQDSTSRTTTKVPFLGDIPLFGKLFRDTQTTDTREEIVFALRVVPVLGGVHAGT